MPEGTKPQTRTSEMNQPRELREPNLLREASRPRSIPEMPDGLASTTGVMPVYDEPGDPSASREDNKPI